MSLTIYECNYLFVFKKILFDLNKQLFSLIQSNLFCGNVKLKGKLIDWAWDSVSSIEKYSNPSSQGREDKFGGSILT